MFTLKPHPTQRNANHKMHSYEHDACKGWCLCIRYISRDASDLVLSDDLPGDILENLAGDLRILTGLAEYLLDVQGCRDARRAKAIACVRLAHGKLASANWHCEVSTSLLQHHTTSLEDALWLLLTAADLLGIDRGTSATLMADALHAAASVRVNSAGSGLDSFRAALGKGLERLDEVLRQRGDLGDLGALGDFGATGLDLSSTKCSLAAYHATFSMVKSAGMRLERIFVPGLGFRQCGSNQEEGFWSAVHDKTFWKHIKEVHVARAPVLRGLASEIAETVEHLSIMGGSFRDVCDALKAFTNLKRLTISGTLHYGTHKRASPPAHVQPLRSSIEEVVVNTLVTGRDGLDGLGPLALAKELTIDLNMLESSCKPELLLAQVLKLPNARVHGVVVCKSKCSDEVMCRIAEVLPELPCLTICIEEVLDDDGYVPQVQLPQVGFYLHEVANLLQAYLPGLRKVKLQGFGCRATDRHAERLRKSLATLYDGLSLEIVV